MKPITKRDAWRRPREGQTSTHPKPLVLYVEDDPENRNVMAMCLGDRYELVLAANDCEACEAMRARGNALSLILMDIELKGSVLNGVELASVMTGRPLTVPLPEHARDVPVTSAPLFFVTAYGAEYDTSMLRAAGGQRMLRKPVDFAALTEAMSAALAR